MTQRLSIQTLSLMTVTAGLMATTALAEERQVTIASWGGSYQDAQSKALFEPAEANTGISVRQETYGGIADVRLQVSSGQVTFDIVVSGSGSAARGCRGSAGAAGLRHHRRVGLRSRNL